jgi:hypothetical protein
MRWNATNCSRMLLLAIGISACIAITAFAQSDPFQSNPGPTEAPKPHPRPPRQTEPEPVVVAPQPAQPPAQPPIRPTLFAPGLEMRIAAAAKANNIGVPSRFDFRAPASDAPANSAQFLGAWGPGIWTGGRSDIYTIEEISGNGSVRLIMAWGACCPHNFLYGPGFRLELGKFADGKIVFRDTKTQAVVELELLADGRLLGKTPAQVISLPKLQ